MEYTMCRAYLYSEQAGRRELFRVADPGDELPIPAIGETIKFNHHRYQIASIKVIESPSTRTLATEYRIQLLPMAVQTHDAHDVNISVGFAHTLLFTCPDCGFPIAISHVSDEHNLEMVASLWFQLDCRYCQTSSVVFGAIAKQHWVNEFTPEALTLTSAQYCSAQKSNGGE
jgi:hypothetical protein